MAEKGSLLHSVLFWAVMGPVMALLTLLRPLAHIRVQSLLTYRIGHFSMNTEMYLCERDAGLAPPRTRDYFFHTPLVCNQALKAIIDRAPLRIRRWPVYVMKAVERSGRFQAHVVRTSSRDRHGIFEGCAPHFALTDQEMEQGRAFLRDVGAEEGKYVCLLCRDSAYMEQHLPGADWSYHDYRDVNVDDYVQACEALAEKGYYVFRMGAAVHKPLQSDHPRVLDYAQNGMRTDFLDIFLSATCAFFLSNGSGLDGVAKMFRRPILYTNLVPLCFVRGETARDVILPKLVLDVEGRPLPLSRLMVHGGDKGPGFFSHTDQYLQAGIGLRGNSPEEITEAALEMEARVQGAWTETEQEAALMESFWSHFPRDDYNRVFHARVARAFLSRHADLLGADREAA